MAAADENGMESVTPTEPSVDRPPTGGLSRAELVAELEQIVSRAKSDPQDWHERAGTVSDDLLPNRRG